MIHVASGHIQFARPTAQIIALNTIIIGIEMVLIVIPVVKNLHTIGSIMTDLFLIAHRVRNEPAFDIATQIECLICHDANSCGDYEGPACHECDGDGFWWIIPTSGHRAYPWWYQELTQGFSIEDILVEWPMPESSQDHYHLEAAATLARRSLIDQLNLRPSQPTIIRRI